MMASTKTLAVFDRSLPEGTPLVYEIVGGNLQRTLRGVVRIGEPAEYDLIPGVYEVRLVHPKLGRLTKVLDLTEEPQTVYFSDMAPSMPPSDGFLAMPAEEWSVRWWHHVHPRAPIHQIGGGATTIPAVAGSWPLEPPLPDGMSSIALIDMAGAGSIAVCWPPGANTLEIQRTRSSIVVRPRTGDLRAESMLDYAMEGYPAHASMIRDNAPAYELIDRGHRSLAGALIGAYYLLRVGEARDCIELLRELWENFPYIPDAGVAYGSALLQADAEPESVHDVFLRAAALGIPLYRDGLRRLRAGLDHLFTLSNGKDSRVIDAIEAIRPFQMALRYDNAVTSWKCSTKEPYPQVSDRQRLPLSTLAVQRRQSTEYDPGDKVSS
jgi:hypothetical protein